MLWCNNGVNKSAIISVISSTIIALDYYTKALIESKVMLFESINVLPFLNIVHVQNKGAAFSLFTNLGNNFFIAVSFIALVAIVMYLTRLPKGLELYSLSMILGGAVGNLIDRFRIGKVVDFIDVFVGGWHWPAFNVADSALTVGISLFIIENIRQGKLLKEDS